MQLLTADEVAIRLGVKLGTVYAYVSRGNLTSRRDPSRRRSLFDADEVEALARRGRPRRSTRPTALDVTIETGITRIRDHRITYRGHDVVELARSATFEQAAELLARGESVVLDASFSASRWRAAAATLAADAAADLVELRCQLPSPTAAGRIVQRAARGRHDSDATASIASAMAAGFDDWPSAAPIDTLAPVDDVVGTALEHIGVHRVDRTVAPAP